MSWLSRLAFLKSVADAVEGLDHFEIRLDHLELFAQPLDVAVDGAVVDIHLIVVSRIHQSVAALDYARPGRQRLQNKELRDRQGHRRIVPSASMALGIHLQSAALENLGFRLL